MTDTLRLDPAVELKRWVQDLKDFCRDVERWSSACGWKVAWKELDLQEESLGSYTVPLLIIQTAHGAVFVEPVGHTVMGATGRIDLYAYPSLFRVMLLRSASNGQWRIRTDSGIFLRQPWNEDAFRTLVEDLTGASDELSAQ
jgi:hypothetical protein